MRLAFFEDHAVTGFAPIALMRPVFELLCGRFCLRERVLRTLSVHDWGVFVRPSLAEVFREEFPESHVNDPLWLTQAPTLLINARWLGTTAALQSLAEHAADAERAESSVGRCGETLAFLTIEPFEAALLTETDWHDPLLKIASTRSSIPAPGRVLNRPWDLIERNPELLEQDFEQFARAERARPRRPATSETVLSAETVLSGRGSAAEPSEANAVFVTQPQHWQAVSGTTGGGPFSFAVIGNPELVSIHPTADIDPFVLIDARSGPVTVDADVKVQAFTRIEGPCHIGRGTQLFRANVKAGTTIGPVCRIGGEIEASIIHGFANKYHDGFLGHSYVCPWTNLGALTSNSDLKNDYSTVSVPLSGQSIPSGSKKVGAFIGDHSRTALCSLFNTGSSVGVMTMILPGGELLPKHVPSFSRVWHGAVDDGLNLETALETSRQAMRRRDCELSPAQERLLRFLHRLTEGERQAAMQRAATPPVTLKAF